jgi:hypothetical protein
VGTAAEIIRSRRSVWLSPANADALVKARWSA